MNPELLYTILFTIAFAVILATGEVLHHVLKVRSEFTRKFSHSAASILSLTFPWVYESYEYVLVMGVLFFFILLTAKYKDLLKSIDDVTRKTHGGILLPIAIAGTFTIAHFMDDVKFFIIPIMLLGVSDSLAGITGILYGKKLRKIIIYGWHLKKTYIGSTVFLLTALAICLYALHWLTGYLSPKMLLASFLVATGAALAELLSSKGFDNITVPLTALIILSLF
ncbi:MAG: hypothetical protein RG741_07800 [Bacteroidales bacterium]|nr:hypothetical protein [Bacteroidales bacterium]